MLIEMEVLKADPFLGFLIFGGLAYAVVLILVLIYYIFKGFLR
ncbi:hypothetical protein SAMN04487943_12224 [Gracilibacillus orientalis]|uniref:Uncharacterized protein n=1 Tax=Gracilibacillus orientalis TaxID=334253 RepID=A0A1I4RBD4_9BACI|nr:hypothetical protein [Gracilibacillus orientalis]SFM33487.1 hypothetical protein SAMN04487943_1142 [Gracilibacillus orientalis]SFM49270.1 hypothetical protein SAMN04487943_12224 [Gracilibacillus orientalis]